MVSDKKSRKPSCFRETAKDRQYKQNSQHNPGSLESTRIKKADETGERIRQAQTKQAVADTPENLLICMEYCGTCPSLPFPPEPLLFCARGCSSEMVSKKSCNCPACPIYKKHRLQNLYFCETGEAAERKEIGKHG